MKAILNPTVKGAALIANASAWRTSAHVGQSLLIVIGKGADGTFLPTKRAWWGEELADSENFSRIVEVRRNRNYAWCDLLDTYPSEDYVVLRGEMRGNVLTFHV